MKSVISFCFLLCFAFSSARLSVPDPSYTLTDALLREVVAKMGEAANADYLMDLPPERAPQLDEEDAIVNRVAKEYESPDHSMLDGSPLLDTQETMLRDQEYLQHSSLWGHQYVGGGAGEGSQRLKPDGSIKNVQEIKTDNILPAYCNPPNPCPVGYTHEDGCMENFVNSAAFSRDYQGAQDCICDTEHMFDCPGASRNSEINALAQSIQNEGVMDSTINKILENMHIDGQHKKLVAKKFHPSREPVDKSAYYNPYLTGDKLPVVAKKAPSLSGGVY